MLVKHIDRYQFWIFETVLIFIYRSIGSAVLAFPFLQCFIKVAVHRKGLESSKVNVYVNKRPSLQQKTLLPNASSVVPPLIPWLCDITLGRHITHLHILCILICKDCFFDKLLCCCLQCWVRHVWTDQSEETRLLGREALKRRLFSRSNWHLQNHFFGWATSLKPKDSSFTIIKSIKSWLLEPKKAGTKQRFAWKMTETVNRLSNRRQQTSR